MVGCLTGPLQRTMPAFHLHFGIFVSTCCFKGTNWIFFNNMCSAAGMGVSVAASAATHYGSNCVHSLCDGHQRTCFPLKGKCFWGSIQLCGFSVYWDREWACIAGSKTFGIVGGHWLWQWTWCWCCWCMGNMWLLSCNDEVLVMCVSWVISFVFSNSGCWSWKGHLVLFLHRARQTFWELWDWLTVIHILQTQNNQSWQAMQQV